MYVCIYVSIYLSIYIYKINVYIYKIYVYIYKQAKKAVSKNEQSESRVKI